MSDAASARTAAATPPASATWGRDDRTVVLVAHNVSTRYLAYVVDAVIGVVMLPFNLSHLGMAAYGLWMLTSSITTYFSMLDLGYGGALVRFVAQYRARRDASSLNEILSTLSLVYTCIGALTYAGVIAIAFNLHLVTSLTPDQVDVSRTLLLIVGANVALRFVFGVFGGVIVGFQRYHMNNVTSIVTSLIVAAANVAVLLMGYGVVALVATTTAIRILALFVYRMNAYRVYPGLSINWKRFNLSRLREVSGFSVFMLALDAAYKLNYSTDVLVIGSFVGAAAVALWAPAQRLAEMSLRLSNQLSEALFPVVVDCDASQRDARLRTVFVQGTRLSLATVLPIAGGLALLAHPLLAAWIDHSFTTTATVVQILAVVVIVRVGSSTASVVLKGGGMHKRLTTFVGLMSLANLGLSIALIPRLGLVGVAVGTLVPVAATTLFGLFPTACRRVGVSIATMCREAVWPALWPGIVAGGVLVLTRHRLPATLAAVASQLVLATAIYYALFALAIGAAARREYWRQVEVLLGRSSNRMSRVGTANAL
ncbi:MAG TPA: oligosaccharide flippase family protein [Vicinamibacterales bacterium]|nr:oligosaccharide flippase family protein [Vicinamibacterales bacterium]